MCTLKVPAGVPHTGPGPLGDHPRPRMRHWPGMPNPWPLVGRAAELADVADAMDLGAGGVLFAGPAGVGKTRLATECLGLAEERHWSTAVELRQALSPGGDGP
jgi:hypothetical protein